MTLQEALDQAAATRQELDRDTDELNLALQEAERAIQDLKFGVRASVQLDEHRRLEWGRFDHKWCLIVLRGDEEEKLANATRATRLIAVDALPTLVFAMVEAVSLERDRVQKATETAKQFVESIRRP